MQVQPYLFFEGRCDEAAAFYKKAVDAEVTMLMRFKDAPQQEAGGEGCAPGAAPPGDKVMHMNMRIGDAMVMASDGHCSGKPNFQGVALSLLAKDPAEARRLFDGLADGGQVQMPMGPTFFSPAFGMLADRFGVNWMILAERT
jgi:PhnB protein